MIISSFRVLIWTLSYLRHAFGPASVSFLQSLYFVFVFTDNDDVIAATENGSRYSTIPKQLYGVCRFGINQIGVIYFKINIVSFLSVVKLSTYPVNRLLAAWTTLMRTRAAGALPLSLWSRAGLKFHLHVDKI